jgi:hypothetical protein
MAAECSEQWDGSLRHVEILSITLNPDAPEAQGGRRGDRGSGPHEGIEDQAFVERKHCADETTHEALRLQRRVRGDAAFLAAGGCRVDEILERQVF